MRCIVCSSNDWENVDQYRHLPKHKGEPVGMSICKKCGFISYPDKYKTKDEILEYYRKDYRGGPPQHGNLLTGKRKIYYHEHFLKDVLREWGSQKKAPVIGEVGSAIGMVLNWFRRAVQNAELHGVELTETYKRVAFHEYGLHLKDELDFTKKYDLIMSYKVAEHQMDVDVEIRKYAEALSEGGYLYISVPTWFNALHNPGVGGFDLEYYYHVDHINVWTRIHFEEILRKSGLKIKKVERLVYGDTYLCVRDDSVMEHEAQYEDPEQIKACLGRIKNAFGHMQHQKAGKALEEWGNFPSAWALYYEQERANLDKKHNGDGQMIAETFCKEMLSACGDTLETRFMASDILMRYGHLVQAMEMLDRILDDKPSDVRALLNLSHCYRKLAATESDRLQKSKLILTARDICRRIAMYDEKARPEAYNWILRDESELTPEDIELVLNAEKQIKSEEC